MRSTSVGRCLASVASVLLVATTALAQTPLPAPEGSSAVGYWRTTLVTIGDSERPAEPDRRTLLLEFWYPARHQSNGVSTKKYASAAIEAALARQLDLAAQWAAPVTTHAVENSPPLGGKHPVVLFSHGLSWPISLYQSFTEDLASRGYIVIGINHPHGAVVDFGDGRVSAFVPPPRGTSDSVRDAFLARLTNSWTQDIRAVLAQLSTWGANAQSTPVSAHLDPTRLAVIGHSLGASAAAHLTADRRVRAVVGLEGRLRDTAAATLTVHAPFLHLVGEYNRLELENRDYRPSPGAPVYQAVIAGTGHAYFSDLMAIYKQTASSEWLARHRYELEPERIIQITRDYVAAFLGRYLLDIDSVLLHPVGYAARVDGPRAAGYPEVHLTIDTP